MPNLGYCFRERCLAIITLDCCVKLLDLCRIVALLKLVAVVPVVLIQLTNPPVQILTKLLNTILALLDNYWLRRKSIPGCATR